MYHETLIFVFSIADAGPQTPYLSTLSAQDLENLGLKAVAAGAEPTKLQQVSNFVCNNLLKVNAGPFKYYVTRGEEEG